MQNLDKLSDTDKQLVALASAHAKERYQDNLITIAGALRTRSGKIYTGINLKYRVRNTSTCAETMAIYAALNDGVKDFDTVVGVKYFPESDSFEIVNACGWCRQLYIYNTPLKAIMDIDGVAESVPVETLLPHSFK